jgi:putative ABC transport system permease protein
MSFQLFKLAWKNLFRNPRRTTASLVTVAFGAAGLLVFQGFNEGIMNQYRENTIRGYYGYGQVYPKDYYGKVLERPWESWIQNWQEADKKIKSIPEVLETFPRLSFYSFLVKGGINLGGRGEGILPERENSFFNQMNFIQGSNLTHEDEIILGKGLAESLNVKVGDQITLLTQTISNQLNGADMKVAGVFHMGIKAIDDQYFRLHLNAAQRLLDTDKIELFSLNTGNTKDWASFEKKLLKTDLGFEPISFEILDAVYYKNSVDFLEAQFGVIRLIILMIVALGIFNTISVGLFERSGEVGALRANGETRKRIWKILLLENLMVGILGGLLGVMLAIMADKFLLQGGISMPPGPGITRRYLIFLEIQRHHFAQALLLPGIATVAASFWPIWNLQNKKIPQLLGSH